MSSFSTAISGLNAAANNIAVISNNIANSNTTGFKQSVAQFADVYSNSFQGSNANTGGTTQPGSGVSVIQDTQQFNQGAAQTTGNNLNMAINGNGFFTLAPNPAQPTAVVYSRAGSFQVNSTGMIVNPQGQALMAYQPNTLGSASAGFSTGAMKTLVVPSGSGLPQATTAMSLSLNLNASATPPPITTTFNALDPTSYTSQTSTTIYDSLGGAHNMTSYFVAPPAPIPPALATSTWSAYHYITDNPAAPIPIDASPSAAVAASAGPPATLANPGVGTPDYLDFNTGGQLTSVGAVTPVPAPVPGAAPTSAGATLAWTPASGAPMSMTMDYGKTTQVTSAFSVNASTQDGVVSGTITGVTVDANGIISANYSNGKSTVLGEVALTNFNNPQGLMAVGNTNWAQTSASGTPISGEAGAGSFGSIQSGAVEQSNVNLSDQLVALITAQQAYSANSQAITAGSKMIETILNAAR
jgi:flagellar hook protein FlgE